MRCRQTFCSTWASGGVHAQRAFLAPVGGQLCVIARQHTAPHERKGRDLLSEVQVASGAAGSLVLRAFLRNNVEHVLDSGSVPGLLRSMAHHSVSVLRPVLSS